MSDNTLKCITETLMVQRDKIDWERAQVLRFLERSRSELPVSYPKGHGISSMTTNHEFWVRFEDAEPADEEILQLVVLTVELVRQRRARRAQSIMPWFDPNHPMNRNTPSPSIAPQE